MAEYLPDKPRVPSVQSWGTLEITRKLYAFDGMHDSSNLRQLIKSTRQESHNTLKTRQLPDHFSFSAVYNRQSTAFLINKQSFCSMDHCTSVWRAHTAEYQGVLQCVWIWSYAGRHFQTVNTVHWKAAFCQWRFWLKSHKCHSCSYSVRSHHQLIKI